MADAAPEDSLFPPTQWTQLAEAARGEDAAQLDRLIRLYWAPLRGYFVASFPSLRGRADEWLQDFSQDRILREGWLGRADRTRGRFRDFLKTSLRNFTRDRLDRAEHKRAPMPLDLAEEPAAEPAEPADQFDLQWARIVLAETLRRMEEDCRNPAQEQPRRERIWELFRLRMLEPILQGAEPAGYEALVAQFGLKSPSEAFNTLLSAKRMFKSHLERVVGEYAGADRATAAEIEALAAFLQGLEKKGRKSGRSAQGRAAGPV
jgi:hypothetical protein